MNHYLNDKIFTFSLVLALSTGSYLLFKQLRGGAFKSIAQPIAAQQTTQPVQTHTPVAPRAVAAAPASEAAKSEEDSPTTAPVPEHQQSQEQMEKLIADEQSKHGGTSTASPSKVTSTSSSSSSPLDTGAAGAYIPFVPGKRKPASEQTVRPKAGGDEWLVGKSENADARDLSAVLKLAADGDTINVEGGTHEVFFNMINADKLKIRGLEPDTLLIYKPNFQQNNFGELTIMNVNLEFADVQKDYLSLGGGKTKLNMIGVKVNQPNLTLAVRDQIYLVLYDVQFTGITLRFSGQSRGLITKSYFDNAKTLISLADQADVDLSDSQFYNFTNVAITSDSLEAKLKAKNIKVANGGYAFWGKFNPQRHEVRESAFTGLKEFTLSETKVNCSVCEKSKIER